MKQQRKILIVDDEVDLCHLLKSYFLKKHYEVYLSHTLEQGLAFVKTLKPDVVFLDNNLPDGSGWEAAPFIAKENPQAHVHLISAYHPELPDLSQNERVTVIEKPISLADLDAVFHNSSLSINS